MPVTPMNADDDEITVSMAMLSESAIALYENGLRFGQLITKRKTIFKKMTDAEFEAHVKKIGNMHIAEFAEANGYELVPMESKKTAQS